MICDRSLEKDSGNLRSSLLVDILLKFSFRLKGGLQLIGNVFTTGGTTLVSAAIGSRFFAIGITIIIIVVILVVLVVVGVVWIGLFLTTDRKSVV